VARPLYSLALFAGGGGLELGLDAALGVRPVVYVEREAFACAVLLSRMEEGRLAPAPVWTDVATFDARPFRGLVDLVAGGSPCQDLSIAGKRAGIHGERSGLFWHQLRVARECEAPLFAWENVGGARSALGVVEAALADAGYRGASVAIRASDVGAPHRRLRIFLLAYRGSVGLSLLRAAHDGDGRHAHRHDADGRDAVVADACGARHEGGELGETSGEGARASRPARECRPHAWPPGPDDADGWRRYLAAGWADRLRLLGNGVVPQQAAAAFRFLAERLLRTAGPRDARGHSPARRARAQSGPQPVVSGA
jgi:DNA (cytosine-5)-methyltransferase 1